MIDTDKYEGHAEGNWDWDDIGILMDVFGTPIAEMTEGWNTKEATAQLIADAPLLLEEVKRLNALIHNDNNWLKLNHPKVFDEMMMSKLFGEEE